MDLHPIIEILKNAPEAAGLKLGDLLRVKVLAVEESTGRALVEIGRLRASAEVRFPVAPGEEFWVRVTETENRLSLQLVRKPVGREGPSGAAPDPLPPLGDRLPDTLAPAGRRALAAAPSGAEPRPAAASEALQVLHFALPAPEGRPAGTLQVAYRARRSENPDESHQVSLLLTLDRLGPVRADLLQIDRRLHVAVFVCDPGTREYVERHLADVKETLTGFFDEVGFQVTVSEARIARFALEELRPAGEGRVDLRV